MPQTPTTHSRVTARRFETTRDTYADQLFRATVRLLEKRQPRRTAADRDDIAQRVVEGFLVRAADILARYPDPAVYAGVRYRHASIGFDRDTRVQRCEGSELVRHADGTCSARRTTVSGNTPVGDDDSSTELFDLLPTPVPGIAELLESIAATATVDALLAPLTPLQQQGLRLVHGLGYTVTEAAAELGCSREHLSRQIKRAVSRIRATDAQMILTA